MMAIKLAYFPDEKENKFSRFLFGMSPDVPAFKVSFKKKDEKFWIRANDY